MYLWFLRIRPRAAESTWSWFISNCLEILGKQLSKIQVDYLQWPSNYVISCTNNTFPIQWFILFIISANRYLQQILHLVMKVLNIVNYIEHLLGLASSQDHSQRFSQLQTSNKLPAGFELVQNLSFEVK